MRSLVVFTLVLTAVAAVGPSSARAGGFEIPGGAGTRALGRGGALYARADDPMALFHNPASLSAMGGYQVMLTGGVAWADSCYQRASEPLNTYEDRAGSTGFPSIFDQPGMPSEWTVNQPWPRTCNSGGPGPLLNLAATFQLAEGLGIGVGILAPNAVANGVWSDRESYTIPGGTTTATGTLPPPHRYQLLEQNQILLYPSIGVGYSPVPWLRFGATFQWGLGVFNFTNIVVAAPGEDPSGDVRARVDGEDFFVPAVIGSVHVVPHNNLDVSLTFRWADAVRAGSTTKLNYGQYGTGAADGTVAGPVLTETVLTGGELRIGQPWVLTLGVRYAHRMTPRPRDPRQIEALSGRIEDSMSNEWFDIELDASYEINTNVSDLVAELPAGAALNTRDSDGMGGVSSSTIPLPTTILIPHNWNDQLVLRLGGDFNMIPGLLSLRLGASFETSAYQPFGFSNRDAKQYVGLDFLPGQRFGVHGGLTVRLGRFDVSLAYAHVFQETIDLSDAEAGQRQISATTPENGSITNAGKYEIDYDILTMGVNWHI